MNTGSSTQASTMPPIQARQVMDSIVGSSNRVLMKISTVFPFTFFPDTLVIDEAKVTIIHWNGFFTKTVFPILIENIMNVTLSTSLFFASLQFEVIGFETNPDPITHIQKSQAIKARKVITGLMTLKKQRIDLSGISTEELMQKIEQIGESHVSL
jgi:hypothetical protein